MQRVRNPSLATVRQRWERLPESARALLAAFAVHPEPLRSAWLPDLAPEGSDVDTLAATRWIEETDTSEWILMDGTLRGAVEKLTPWSVRQSQHRVLAGLCRRGKARPALAALHLAAIGDREGAATAWIEAATSKGAGEDAVRALQCLEAAHRVIADAGALGSWEKLACAVERCTANPAIAAALITKLEEWLKDARHRQDHGLIGRIGPVYASLLAAAGKHVEGAEWRVESAKALRKSKDSRGAARQLVAATMTYAFALQYSAARQTATLAVTVAEESGDAAVHVEALSSCGLLLGMRGDTASGRDHLERALDLALKHRLTSSAAEAYRMLGTVAEYASCYGDEQTAFAKALAYCRRHDETASAELCLGCLSYSLFRSGNWPKSRVIVEDVLGRPRAPLVSKMVAKGVLGLLLAHRGELREAAPLLEGTIQGARQTGIFAMEFFGRWGLALVEEQSGQQAAAALHYRNLLEFWRSTEDRHDVIPGLTCGGLFFADQRNLEEAREFAESLERIAQDTANPEAIGAAALVEGELLRRSGKFTAAAVALERALAAFEKRDLVIERVRALGRYAAVQRALGHDRQAKQASDEAVKRAKRLGARALFTAAKTSETDDDAQDAWSGLSPRQRDVARHLKRGATNKEIAAQLGVSVRTVDMHVAHLLKRLDCRTRAEAAGRIAVLLE